MWHASPCRHPIDARQTAHIPSSDRPLQTALCFHTVSTPNAPIFFSPSSSTSSRHRRSTRVPVRLRWHLRCRRRSRTPWAASTATASSPSSPSSSASQRACRTTRRPTGPRRTSWHSTSSTRSARCPPRPGAARSSCGRSATLRAGATSSSSTPAPSPAASSPSSACTWTSSRPTPASGEDKDKLHGRGTTDCLGHVALVAQLMRRLGEVKPPLKHSVIAVFIANEENSSVTGIGVDGLVKDGLLDKLKTGPLFWIDTADKQPCIGTGGMIPWHLKATGKLFHSGLAHKAINSMEMNMEALKEIQKRFYADFLPHEKERVYKFATPSTMKPTKWSYPGGGLNQIPGECTISGDIRLTPFYSTSHVVEKLKAYVEDINETLETTLDTRGPVSKYVLPDENLRGRLEITFDGDVMNGVACNLESRGFKALCKATEEIVGHVEPYSITGSLPLIRELQDEGFDVQTAGYGLLKTYHAKNEYCLLPDMAQGFQVFVSIISQLEEEV